MINKTIYVNIKLTVFSKSVHKYFLQKILKVTIQICLDFNVITIFVLIMLSMILNQIYQLLPL